MNETLKQQISAYVDGELPANESELLVRRLGQDDELRSLAADYMAIGRAVRGERSVPGMGALRARIAGEIGETPPAVQVSEEPAAKRIVRPLAGVAIAASVALAALLGLQQVGPGELPAVATANTDLAAVAIDDAPLYTEPPVAEFVSDRPSERLARYYRYHNERAADIGGSGIFTRLVGLELRGGELVPAPAAGADAPRTGPDDANGSAETARREQD